MAAEEPLAPIFGFGGTPIAPGLKTTQTNAPSPNKRVMFVGHTRKDHESVTLALELHTNLDSRLLADARYDGFSGGVWLDVKMPACSEADMQEGVEQCCAFVAIISERYFERE